MTACTVDPANRGFQCYSSKNKYSLIPFSEGANLQCASSQETEAFMKACAEHKVIPVTLCSYVPGLDQFRCMSPDKVESLISIDEASSHACMSEKDRRRLSERCLKSS